MWTVSQSKTLRVTLNFQASVSSVHCLSKTHGPGWMYFCDLWHLYVYTKWDVLSSNVGPPLTRRPTQPLVCTQSQKNTTFTNGCAFLIQTWKDVNTASMFTCVSILSILVSTKSDWIFVLFNKNRTYIILIMPLFPLWDRVFLCVPGWHSIHYIA